MIPFALASLGFGSGSLVFGMWTRSANVVTWRLNTFTDVEDGGGWKWTGTTTSIPLLANATVGSTGRGLL